MINAEIKGKTIFQLIHEAKIGANVYPVDIRVIVDIRDIIDEVDAGFNYSILG